MLLALLVNAARQTLGHVGATSATHSQRVIHDGIILSGFTLLSIVASIPVDSI
ncbi:MAG: hypothetical protein CM1200mP6_05930 [Anaerolineaceae bacterium]|nr:MAG: hypothetical protein CM1200mP6_05930 [Anaerolineaceae bacterium]